MTTPVPYKDVFIALAKNQIRYLVVGGFAVNFHQVQRATMDLDLMVHLENENVSRFISVLGQLGFKPRAPVPAIDFANVEIRKKWIQEKGMMVFSFFHPQNQFEIIDVFVDEPKPFDELFTRRTSIRTYGIEIPVIGVEDLKDLKRAAGRDKDLFDLSQLEKKR